MSASGSRRKGKSDAPAVRPSANVPTVERRKKIFFPLHLKVSSTLNRGDKSFPRQVKMAQLTYATSGSVPTPKPALPDADTTEI